MFQRPLFSFLLFVLVEVINAIASALKNLLMRHTFGEADPYAYTE